VAKEIEEQFMKEMLEVEEMISVDVGENVTAPPKCTTFPVALIVPPSVTVTSVWK